MTRKDYKMIAQALNDKISYGYDLHLIDKSRYAFFVETCEVLATRFGEDNPRFNRDKFLEVCLADHEI